MYFTALYMYVDILLKKAIDLWDLRYGLIH